MLLILINKSIMTIVILKNIFKHQYFQYLLKKHEKKIVFKIFTSYYINKTKKKYFMNG